MTPLILYLITFAIFLGLDVIGLTHLVKPVFDRHIGGLLLDTPRYFPAFLFYAFFIAVVIWFVSWPAITEGHSLGWVVAHAALLGAMAYGTYEFSNLATIKGWTWSMVAVDLAWGTVLTAVSTGAGFALTRAIT